MRYVRALVGAGAAAALYTLAEPYTYRLTTKKVLVEGAPALSILHLSDTHMKAWDLPLGAWLRRLPDALPEQPDLVIATGDMIDDDRGIDLLAEALGDIKGRFGNLYVLGLHDYYQAIFRFPTKYFTSKEDPLPTTRADVGYLEQRFRDLGWISLNNTTEFVQTPAGRIRLSGVDDPHIHRDRADHIERGSEDGLAIGLVHSPNVVSPWLLNGFDLVLAGHTHAGQVRMPFAGALVTNSSLPTRLAGGLHRIGNGWLHVSPGLGVSKFTPIRFLARPEATLLQIRGA